MKIRGCKAALFAGLLVSAAAFGEPTHQPSARTIAPQWWLAQHGGTGPVDCFSAAKVRTYLDDEQASRLCRCRRTPAAVDCFVDAKVRTYLDDERALRLCSSGEYAPLGCLE